MKRVIWQVALEAKNSSPWRQPKRKQVTQSYNFKELNCANKHMSLEKDSKPQMRLQLRLTLLIAVCETLEQRTQLICAWAPTPWESWDNKTWLSKPLNLW